MRILFLLSVVVIGLCACNNNLTTIGQDLIFNDNTITREEYSLTNTGTVRIDSFITSGGIYGNAPSQFYIGKYSDKVSGTTVAQPCFQLSPSSIPSIPRDMNLDSVTFNFKYAGKLWGDTLTAKPQMFYLYQLDQLPTFDTKRGWYFYNNSKIPSATNELAKISFLPKTRNMDRAYFKLENDDPLVTGLFNLMKFDDQIFRPNTSNAEPYHDFLNYFKGLTIKSDPQNDCLFTILASSDSLYMRFHYHVGDNQYYYDLKMMTTNPEYQYNTFNTERSDYFTVLNNQQDEVLFTANEPNIAVAQGLTGYMVKIILPDLPPIDAYTTIIKAEIEIKPRVYANTDIPMPKTIYVYKTNKVNEIQEALYNSISGTSGDQVTGTYINDEHNMENNRYLFDITDYFQGVVTRPTLEPLQNQLMLTIPDLNTSLNRMIIKETPILRVYYAKYFEQD